jgi:hypothetical protein
MGASSDEIAAVLHENATAFNPHGFMRVAFII